MFSVLPQATTRSAPPISSAASGVAKPPETSRYHGSPANSPLAAADTASSAPHRSASAAPAGPRRPAGAPRPAMNTGRRAGAARRPARPTRPPAGPAPAFGLAGTRRRAHGADRQRACTSSGRPSTTVRRRRRGRGTRGRVGDGARPAAYPAQVTAPTAAASAGWSMKKFDRGRGRLRRQHHQRGAALRRLGDAGQRVGDARALVHGEHGRPAATTRA